MNKIYLQAERIILRLVELSDLESVHELHSSAQVDKFNTLGIPENILETKMILESLVSNNHLKKIEQYTFAIEQIGKNNFIGLIALNLSNTKYQSAEVWFKLSPEFWNKGFGTEALHRIIKFGFSELNLHRIEAGCATENVGSIKLLEKVGMIREGRKRKVLPLKSGWSDNYQYAILENEFVE